MKRSSQEIIELIVFALIALTVGTGLMWLLGQIFAVFAVILGFLAGVVWFLLRFLIPIALVAGLVYFAVNALLPKNKVSGNKAKIDITTAIPKNIAKDDSEIKNILSETEAVEKDVVD